MRDNADDVPEFEGQVVFKGDFDNPKLKPALRRLFSVRTGVALGLGLLTLYIAYNPMFGMQPAPWAFTVAWVGSTIVNGVLRQ